MTPISLPGPHIVYYTLRFTFFTTVLLGDVSHFQISGTFTKKPYKKGSQHSSCRFSCTFCPDFVNLYNKPLVEKGVTIMTESAKQVPL